MACPNVNSPEWKSLVDTIGENNAWKEFLKFGEIPDSSIYESDKKDVLYSIRTKSTEEISKGIDPELIKSDRELKYTSFIGSAVINTLGDISPNKRLEVSPDAAFASVKSIFEDIVGSLKMALSSFIKSDEDLQEIKKSSSYNEILENFPVIAWVNSYKEFQTALQTYSEIVNNFDRYKEFVIAELAHEGIRLVKDRIELIVPEDISNKEEDDNSDDTSLPSEEINTQKFNPTIFETNPYDTATLRVKALMQTIKTGEYELGIPLYADPQDVMADMLYAGSAMDLSGYTDMNTKLEVFRTQLELRKDGRPYLDDLLAKINEFEKDGQWETINQILTFASKAFANENLLIYKLQRQGTEVISVSQIKTIASNRDKIEDQVSRHFLAQHKASNFFRKTAVGDFYPKEEKVKQLDEIRREGKVVQGQAKIDKFIEFFGVLGIKFTNKDMEYIAPRLSKAIRKGQSFDIVFADGQFLDNIYKSFNENMTTSFKDDYGLQDEKSSMKAVAQLYYDANPGMYKIVSSKTADGKSKHLYIQPNYVEIQKREWDNSNDTSNITNTALAKPSESFWKKVKQAVYNFTLGYFNGSREQEKGKDGKVRKNFTKKEQMVTMLLKHQENMNTGTYILFTLSDKITTIESKVTKEFFLDDKNSPVGLEIDYSIKDGKIVYSNTFKDKVYNSFVEPEINRILAGMRHSKNINLENFDVSSKLFYFFPRLNSEVSLEDFRKDLYSGTKSLEELKNTYGRAIADVVIDEFSKSSASDIEEFINNGIVKFNKATGDFAFSLFKSGYAETDYVNRFRKTGVKGYELAHLMMMDMKFNYMNAQIKSIQFLKFDPMNAFKPVKGMDISSFDALSGEDKIALVDSTWDEFSKRAAALIAPGSQGNYTWKYGNNKTYSSQEYNAVTVNDIGTTTDAQEFVTMQEHIDYLMSEGKIPKKVWESIHKKIVDAGPGGYYELSKKELDYMFTPVKPVHVNNMKLGEQGQEDITGLNRIDYIKTSRYPLIPEHEANSERDKLRQWMERNNIQSLNFASGKKLGRPRNSVTLFDKDGNFTEPNDNQRVGATQVLSRDGLRNQQEIPHQKDRISTITQMNRTLFDGLLESKFSISSIKEMTGYEAKAIKERIRAKLFDMEAEKLRKEIGDLSKSHRGIHRLLKDTIVNDTTGTYTENDLKSIELGKDGFFQMDIEFQFKQEKLQGLINSMINKNVMLKVDGSSFVQVSGVGAKYSFSELSKGVKSGIIWTDKYAKNFKKGAETKLDYIQKDARGNIKPAQVIVSQYLRDKKGNLIDLSEYITEKNGVKILDTSKFSPEMFELVASRIPNQSHVSMLPVEVVGFLPEYMENTIIVPDGITDQMGSDFDVDKLYAYTSKIVSSKNEDGITTYSGVDYDISNISDVDKLNRDQLEQLYRDLHWMVLTHPDAFEKITKSVDNPEVKEKVNLRKQQLKKYNITPDVTSNLPLDFMTSINRFTDNKSGKSGVSIFANLISAQADMQDKIIQLGVIEEGRIMDHPKPIMIKLSKKSKDVLDLKYIGQTGESTSFLNKKRSISDNLNIQFTESVDNAKNQFLREFGWDEKTMGAVGILQMFTDEKGRAVPIEFSMDLTSQPALKKLSEKVEQKQDSFGEYDFNAIRSSITEIQDDIIQDVEKTNLLGVGVKAAEHFENPNRDNVLDPETLSDMWLVGQAMSKPKEERDALLKEMVTDFNKKYGPKTYSSIDDLMLKYFESQYDALNLFERLQDTGRELMTILGSVYTYTKGIGPNVFATKQKLEQLNKLSFSPNFVNIENVAGEVKKDDSGNITIKPRGEIGSSIKNSLIVAQELYGQLFPISTGKSTDQIVTRLLADQGTKKEEIGKQRYIDTFKNVFNAVKSYMYTVPNLELFDNVKVTRDSLINGETSIGKRVIDLLKQPEFSKNGFLKNIEVDVNYNGAHIISFRAPLGTEINDKAAISGFYQLATHKSEEIRQLAKDIALYPFATGDAGYTGRFIPVDYYLSDKDFAKAMRNMAQSFAFHMTAPTAVSDLVQQIVQNNAETYAKKFTFSSGSERGVSYSSLFKQILSPLINNADDLSKVKTFSFKLGDFERNKKATGLVNALKVKLSEAEIEEAKNNGIDASDMSKYPPYILITDSYTSGFDMGSRSERYLYKRTSSFLDPVATYERVNILGYKNIKEYEFDNPGLRSVIKDNAVDPVDEEMMPEEKEEAPGEYKPNELKGKMTYSYGDNKRADVTADTTFDAILKGERTATTRYTSQGNLDYWKQAKVGDIITWESGDGRKVDVQVTKALEPLKGSGKTAEQWSKLEGWSKEYFEKNVRPKLDEAWQMEYKLVEQPSISTKPKGEKVVEGDIFAMDGIPVITTNLEGVHGAGLAQIAKSKGFIQQGDGEFKITDKVVQLPVKGRMPQTRKSGKGAYSETVTGENVNLLKEGLRSLIIHARQNPDQTYLLPLAGLGHGEGKIEEILPILIQTVQATNNIKLVLPGEDVNLGRQGTVRRDYTRENLPQIKEMIEKAFISGEQAPVGIPAEEITEEDVLEEQGFTPEITEYKGTSYYVFGTEEEGDMIVHAVRKDGKIGEIIKNKDLKNKVVTKKLEDTHPEWIVELTNMQNSPRYMVMPAGEIISLAPTNYGKQIISDDIYKKVMRVYENNKLTPIQDQPVASDSNIEKYVPNYIEINNKKIETFKWNKDKKIAIKLTKDQDKAVKMMVNHFEKTPYVPFILKGKAGTGKTTVIRVINEYFKGMRSIIMTPTHKAGKNASLVTYGNTQNKYRTFASSYYSDRANIKEDILIFDEVSMLNDSDLEILRSKIKPNQMAIFMGDQRQLPPIKGSKTSPFFNSEDGKNVYELTEVMRFDEQGSIFKIANRYADNLKKYSVIKQFPEKLISDKDAVYSVDSSKRLIDAYIYHYKLEGNDPSKVRVIVYGNKTAELYNNQIRNIIYKGEAQFNIINNNDLLIGNLGWSTKNVLESPMVNSSEYKVVEEPEIVKRRFEGYTFEGQNITYKEIVSGEFEAERNITVIDPTKEENKQLYEYVATVISNFKRVGKKYESFYNDILNKIEKSGIYSLTTMYAKPTAIDPKTKEILSVELFTLDQMLKKIKEENPKLSEDEILNMIDNDQVQEYYKIEPNLSFGYAITTHKSQGSTYKHVMVDESNMSFRDNSRLVNDQNNQFYAYEANQMRYVAFSRPTTTLVIYTKKPIGDNLEYETGAVDKKQVPGAVSNEFDFLAFRSKINKENVTTELFDFENESKDAKKFLNTIYKATSPLYKEILSAIGKAGGVGQLTFVLDRTMTSPGEYSIADKTVKINPDLIVADNDSIETAREKMHEVIMHELLHHVTADLLNTNPSKLTAEQRKWVMAIENLFEDVQKRMLADPKHRESLLKAIEQSNKADGILSASDKSMYYGLTNKYDFISMLMTDNGFREFMNNTKYEGNKSILDKFIDILTNILKALGVQVKEDSVLKEGVTSIVGLIQSRQGMEFTTDMGAVQKSILTSTKGEYISDNFDEIIDILNIKTVC